MCMLLLLFNDRECHIKLLYGSYHIPMRPSPYDRLDRHVTAVDSEVNPGFVVDDEIFLNCNDKTVAFLCSTSLF